MKAGNARQITALALLSAASLLLVACGGANVATCVLTANSSNPSTGVSIGITAAGSNSTSWETTSFSHSYNSGAALTLTAPATSGVNIFSSWSGCTSTSAYDCAVTLSANTTVTANYVTPAMTTPTVTVLPSSSSITNGQALPVTITVVGATSGVTPGGTVILTSGSYASAAATLNSGRAQVTIAAGALNAGLDTLTVVYTPDTTSAAIYRQATGTTQVTVTVPVKITPTVTVTPSALSILTTQSLTVAVTVTGDGIHVIPRGAVTLTRGSYTAGPLTLSSGNASFTIPANTLASGSDTLLVSYLPDSTVSSTYNSAASAPVTIIAIPPSVVAVNQSVLGPVVSDQLLGMNMGYWYDLSTTAPAVVSAFKKAGITGIHWPGGSQSNVYHWATNTLCYAGTPSPSAAFGSFLSSVVQPGNFDVALTTSYSTNEACNGPADPAEAAAWVLYAKTHGNYVSHVTVGNEIWGFWELPDKHTPPNDPTIYAQEVAKTNGYYQQIKAANPDVLVGVGVDPYYTWDEIVLAQAKNSYDFVEFHFYPGGPGDEDDSKLIHESAQTLTYTLNLIKAELVKAGVPNTPIFVGEVGSVYNDPGKQSTSITQALYAGQVLGEMMNAGIARAAWWIGFGGCTNDPTKQNFSELLYGWQNYGGYMVFSDGLPNSECSGKDIPTVPVGTLLPTAWAYQLFSNVAVTGEKVLTAAVTGYPTDVRAYAATHSGGTAVVVFNLNQTMSLPVTITLSGQSTASSVTMETYSKAIYDQSKDNVWADPTTTDLGARSLPLALTLEPWSMNVIVMK